ncbi:hypothetical protein IYC_08355, partial [Clostridium sporogenes PA 3679]
FWGASHYDGLFIDVGETQHFKYTPLQHQGLMKILL